MSLDISKIKQYPAPKKEYHEEIFKKEQIVIHHTASGGNSKGDMDYLNSDSQGAVNVAFFIDRDGIIWQAFSSKYYAAHLGVPSATFKKFNINNTVDNLHKHSIAIELDNWGYLTKKGDKFYSYTGTEVKDIITYNPPFLGYSYYEKYPNKQLLALKDLLVYLCDTYKIDKTYNEDMWKASKDALSGKNGIYTHVSYRESGKWDCHPQPSLIETLKNVIMNFKFLKDMVMNPDGITYSSKRAAAWVALFTFIGFGIFNKAEHIIWASVAVIGSLWGLTSFDYSKFIGSKPTPTDPTTGDTPVNP